MPHIKYGLVHSIIFFLSSFLPVSHTPILSSLPPILPSLSSMSLSSPLSSMVSWCQIWMSRGHASSLLSALPVVEEILSRLFRRNARILSVVRVDDRHTFYNTYQAILRCAYGFLAKRLNLRAWTVGPSVGCFVRPYFRSSAS